MSLAYHRRRNPAIMRQQRANVIDDIARQNSDMIGRLQDALRQVVQDD